LAVPRIALSPDEIDAFRRRAAEAATRLFARDGYDAVTMRSLADALGVSAMTPYRYLAGKDELFALVRTEAYRRFADRLEDALARAGADPAIRLIRLKQSYVGFAVDEPDAYRIMFELRQPDPVGQSELAAQSRRAFGTLHRTVTEAVNGGVLEGDPLTLAHLLWANTHGLVSLHLAGKLTMGRTLEALAFIDHELPAARPARRAPARQAPRPSSRKTKR
jgi:AcrR family transcriptional regulator